jgi:hypothetical protein
VQLQRLALPRLFLRQDLVDVLEILGAGAQRAPQQAAERADEHDRGHANFDISM